MDNTGYSTLSRQSGLMREMQIVAHNIANVSTTGFRREGMIFAEYVQQLEAGEDSLSMATGTGRNIDTTQGPLVTTGGQFDLAIEGDGFFQIDTPNGVRLTRAGAFAASGEGELVTPEGYRVLDAGGAPLFIPPDVSRIAVGRDGTIAAGDRVLGQLGVVRPNDPGAMQREAGGLFDAAAGFEPVEDPVILQGFLEQSNVSAVAEIARMIEVQHAYEQGQKFMDQENERIRNVIQTLGR